MVPTVTPDCVRTETKKRVVVLSIDDDQRFQEQLQLLLEPLGIRLLTATDLERGMAIVRETALQIVLLDIQVGNANSLRLIPDILAARPGVEVVVVSLHSEPESRARAASLGARAFVDKGTVAEDLPGVLRHMIAD